MEKINIIAATRNSKEFHNALTSKVDIIFMLTPNIADIKKQAESAHEAQKKFFIHLDFAEGIGKDEYGIRFAKEQGVDGIISTRANIIKLAKKEGLFALQRFFIVDSQSINTTIETLKSSKASMIEVMPGNNPKAVKRLREKLDIPIIAGGLIETAEETMEIIKNGASAVSTGAEELWNI